MATIILHLVELVDVGLAVIPALVRDVAQEGGKEPTNQIQHTQLILVK